MSQEFPRIVICEGCTDAPKLQLINDENAARLQGSAEVTDSLQGLQQVIDEKLESGKILEQVQVQYADALAEAAAVQIQEEGVINRVNEISFCIPGRFCARELAYRHNGGTVDY